MRIASVVALLLVACTPKEPVEIGSACSSMQSPEACATGKSAVCVGGIWRESASCAGPKGCYRQAAGHGSATVLCDGAVARVGSSCPASWRGVTYCADDGTAILECAAGVWKAQKTCPGCKATSTGLACGP